METRAHRKRRDNSSLNHDMAMTPCRLAILQALNEFPRLDTEMLYELALIRVEKRKGKPLHLGRFKNTLTDMRGIGGYIYCPPQQFDTINADYKRLIYSLTDRGKAALSASNIPLVNFQPPSNSIFHDWMTCHAIASLKLEAHHTADLSFMSPADILARAPVRQAEHPFKFPVTITWNDKLLEIRNFAPDYAPFGLVYRLPSGKKQHNFFLWETDCGTESVDADPIEGTSLHRKILAYEELDRIDGNGDNQFYHLLKITNNYVCIITTDELQKQRIMKKVEEVSARPEIYLFKVVPHFRRLEYTPHPLAELWHAPWERVNAKPFFLNQPQEA